jgi:hypothetical protein
MRNYQCKSFCNVKSSGEVVIDRAEVECLGVRTKRREEPASSTCPLQGLERKFGKGIQELRNTLKP